MTYLELLNRIKNGTQPEMVLFNDDLYVWYKTSYVLNYSHGDYLRGRLSDREMASKNCIFEIRIIGDEEDVEQTA